MWVPQPASEVSTHSYGRHSTARLRLSSPADGRWEPMVALHHSYGKVVGRAPELLPSSVGNSRVAGLGWLWLAPTRAYFPPPHVLDWIDNCRRLGHLLPPYVQVKKRDRFRRRWNVHRGFVNSHSAVKHPAVFAFYLPLERRPRWSCGATS